MAYRLKHRESVPDGIQRIALEELDRAFERSKAGAGDPDEAIHDVRVSFKKLRALLRLVRREIGVDVYRRENVCFRDAARKLAEVRDTAAMLETLNKLKELDPEALPPAAMRRFRAPLVRRTLKRRRDKGRALAQASETIRTARKRVEDWTIRQDDFSAVASGVRRIYREGRKGFGAARAHPSVESFHEWRKRVKYLWYQVRLLRSIWPRVMRALGRELKSLTELLSDDHDLALLRDKTIEAARRSRDQAAFDVLLSLIDRRRAELQARARRLGERIYTEKPGAIVDRFQTYWDSWRRDGS